MNEMRYRAIESVSTAAPDREAPFRLLAVMEVSEPPGDRHSHEDHAYCTMEFIVSGYGELRVGRKSYQLGPGDVYILHKGSSHDYRADRDDPWHKLFFNADGKLMNDLFRAYGASDVWVISDAPPVEAFFRDLLTLGHEAPPDIHGKAAVVFHQLLIALDAHRNRVAPPHSPLVTRVLQYIEQHVNEDVRMQDIAQHASYTVSHITRTFKLQVGRTPYVHHEMRRIEQARLLLHCTALSVKQIAERLHYADEYYFLNAFKRVVGVAPSHYRAQTQGVIRS